MMKEPEPEPEPGLEPGLRPHPAALPAGAGRRHYPPRHRHRHCHRHQPLPPLPLSPRYHCRRCHRHPCVAASSGGPCTISRASARRQHSGHEAPPVVFLSPHALLHAAVDPALYCIQASWRLEAQGLRGRGAAASARNSYWPVDLLATAGQHSSTGGHRTSQAVPYCCRTSSYSYCSTAAAAGCARGGPALLMSSSGLLSFAWAWLVLGFCCAPVRRPID
jgi:hypothetical protein